MRSRKPCVLARRRLFGWNVRLLTVTPGPVPALPCPGRREGARVHGRTARGSWVCSRYAQRSPPVKPSSPLHRPVAPIGLRRERPFTYRTPTPAP